MDVSEKALLQTADYVIIVLMLAVPLAIGIFFAIRDSKRTTREEYLLGGRNMSMLPVTLSIFVTYQSAISLIGMPSDITQFGPMFCLFYVGVALGFVIAYFTLAPLMYPLRLTSVYEYLELRYESKFVRLLSTVTGMLQTFFYTSVALLAPGLALEAPEIGLVCDLFLFVYERTTRQALTWNPQGKRKRARSRFKKVMATGYKEVWIKHGGLLSAAYDKRNGVEMSGAFAAAGIPLWMSVVIVGVTGTIYTCVGGIKSVVWTDAFQSVIVFVGVFVVIIKTVHDIGGVTRTWELAEAGGRTNFKYFSPDPRHRHTWWSLIIGTTFTWLTNLFGQSIVQRISSMKSLRDVRKSMLINIPVNLFYALVLLLFGWTMYSYLFHIGCDPFQTGLVTNPNQRTPFFVLHSMNSLPGISGLYMSSIFSGSLSTLSSGMNALATNTVEDILEKPLRSVTEKTATIITKVIVLLYGMAMIGVVYIGKSFKGQVIQLAISVFSAFGSSVLGMFLLGSTIPWANKYGAVCGAVTSLALNIWLILGGMFYGIRHTGLEPIPSDGCLVNLTSVDSLTVMGGNSSVTSTESWTSIAYNDPLPETFSFYDISYEWYSVIGTSICFTIGLIVSRITRHTLQQTTDSKLIFGILRRFWNLPEPVVSKTHEYEYDTRCVKEGNGVSSESETQIKRLMYNEKQSNVTT